MGPDNTTSTQKYDGIVVQSSLLGISIPKGWGTNKVGCNLMDYMDFSSQQTSSGKGGANPQYTYKATLLLGIVQGPIYGIRTIYKDQAIYTATASGSKEVNGTTITISSKSVEQAVGITEIFPGTIGQTPWTYLNTDNPTHAIGYSGICYAAAYHYPLDTSATSPNHNFEVQFATYATINGVQNDDANPADIINDLLPDVPRWPANAIADLSNYSTYCLAQGLLLSPVADNGRQASDLLTEIMTCTNSDLMWSDGQLHAVPYGDTTITNNGVTYTPNLTPIYSLTWDDIIPNSKGEDPIQWDQTRTLEAYNYVQVNFLDRTLQYATNTATAVDQANYNEFGPRRASPQEFDSVCLMATASTIAQLMVQRSANVRRTAQFTVSELFGLLDPMDLITVPLRDGGNRLVRIVEANEQQDGSIQLQVEEMLVGAAHAAEYTRQDGLGIAANFNVAPGDTNPPAIINPPLSLTNGANEVWITASGGPEWGGAVVWASFDGDTYQTVGTITQPGRYGVTTTDLPAGTDPDTTDILGVSLVQSGGTLVAGTQADADGQATLCAVGTEIIAYSAAVLTSANCYNLSNYIRRGQEGTTIANQPIGSPFMRLDGSQVAIPYTQGQIGKTVYIKLQAFNLYGGAYEDLDLCEAYTFVAEPNGSNVTDITWGSITGVPTLLSGYVMSGGTAVNTTNVGTASATAIEVLPAEVIALQAQVASAISSVTALQTTTSTLTSDIATANTAIATAQGDATTALGQIATANANLAAEISNRQSGDAENAASIAALTTTVTNNNSTQTANLNTEATTRAGADDALSALITTLSATVGSGFGGTSVTAQINNTAAAQATVNSSVAEQLSALNTSVAANTASISGNYTALSGSISAVSDIATSLQATVGSGFGGTSLTSQINNNYEAFTNAQSTQASFNSALTAIVGTGVNGKTLTSAVNQNASAIATATGQLYGSYTLTTSAGGVITGMQVLSASGPTQISAVIISAANFLIQPSGGVSSVAPFAYDSATGTLLVQNVDIPGALIVSGSITTDQILAGSLTGIEFNAAASLTVGSGTNSATLTGIDPTYLIYAGGQSGATAPFSVNVGGGVNATSLTLRNAQGIAYFTPQGGFTSAALSQLSSAIATRSNTVTTPVQISGSTGTIPTSGAGYLQVTLQPVSGTDNLQILVSYPIDQVAYFQSNTGTSGPGTPSPSPEFPSSIELQLYYRYQAPGGSFGGWTKLADTTFTKVAYTSSFPSLSGTQYPVLQVTELQDLGPSSYERSLSESVPASGGSGWAGSLNLSASISSAGAGVYQFAIVGPGVTNQTVLDYNTTITVNDLTDPNIILGGTGGTTGTIVGAGTFTALADAPSSYTGAAGDLVQVNSGGTALQFVSSSTLSVSYASSAGNASTLGGQSSSYFATAASLGGYLPLTGGSISGAIALNGGVSVAAGVNIGIGYDTGFSGPSSSYFTAPTNNADPYWYAQGTSTNQAGLALLTNDGVWRGGVYANSGGTVALLNGVRGLRFQTDSSGDAYIFTDAGAQYTVVTSANVSSYVSSFSGSISGQVTITAAPTTNSAVLTLNSNTSGSVTPLTNSTCQSIGADNKQNNFEIVASAHTPTYVGRRFDGTAGAKTPVQLGEGLATFAANAYSGQSANGGFATGFPAGLTFLAAENWSAGATGTYATINLTPPGTTTSATVLTLDAYSNLTLAAASPSITTGGGALNIPNGLTVGGSTALTAANVGGYAPTLSGGGATGTWGINVSGNAATVSNLTSAQIVSALGYTPANTINNTFTGLVSITGAPTTSAAVLTLNSNTSGSVTPLPNSTFQSIGADNKQNNFEIVASGHIPTYVGRRFDGTAGSKTAVQAGEALVALGANAYSGQSANNGFNTGYAAGLDFLAAENWSSTANGTFFNITLTQPGTTTTKTSFTLDYYGNIILSGSNPSINSGGSYIIIPNGLYISGAIPLYSAAVINARSGVTNDAGNLTFNPSAGGFTLIYDTYVQIARNVSQGGQLQFGSGGSTSIINDGTNLVFYNQGVQGFYFNTSSLQFNLNATFSSYVNTQGVTLNSTKIYLAAYGDTNHYIQSNQGQSFLSNVSGETFMGYCWMAFQSNYGGSLNTNFFVDNINGRVAVKNTAPAYALHVTGQIYASGSIISNGTTLTSDERRKMGMMPVNDNRALKILNELDTLSYFRMGDHEDMSIPWEPSIGISAQQLQASIIKHSPAHQSHLIKFDHRGYLAIDPYGVMALTAAGVRAVDRKTDVLARVARNHHSEIEKLKARVAEQDTEISNLKARLKAA